MALSPSGLITLTTDFGHKDPFVGVMKGVILGRFPAARIIDLTHEVRAHAPAEGAFWLDRAFAYFPAGTVHVAVIDPGVGTARRALVAEASGHLFLGPDNGLLNAALSRDPSARVHALEGPRAARLGLSAPSATFHGRDLFAPLAALLAQGACAAADLGPPAGELAPSALPEPRLEGTWLIGQVVAVDRFGNLLTNLRGSALAGTTPPQIHAGQRVLPLVRTYRDAERGALVALLGSFDALELAQVEGRADAALELGVGAEIRVATR